MSIFDNFKDKILKAVDVDDSSEGAYAPNNYNDQPAEYDEPENNAQFYRDDHNGGSAVNYSPEPQNGYSQDYYDSTSQRAPYGGESETEYKPMGNIYHINNNPVSTITRIVKYDVQEVYDVKNIADDMKKEDAVIIVDVGALSDTDILRVLSFIDGVKYVFDSQIELIRDALYIIMPKAMRLSGDFGNQSSNAEGFH